MDQTEGVAASAPFVWSEVMLRSKWATSGVIFKGIDPERTGKVTDVADNIKIGALGPVADEAEKWEVLATLHTPPRAIGQDPDDDEELPGIVIGEELADQLKVFVGDRVHVINPVGGGIGPSVCPPRRCARSASRGSSTRACTSTTPSGRT